MTQSDIQNALRAPLIANAGNKLTTELIAGLLVTLSDAMLKSGLLKQAEENGVENG